jgi:hypothetical protein
MLRREQWVGPMHAALGYVPEDVVPMMLVKGTRILMLWTKNDRRGGEAMKCKNYEGRKNGRPIKPRA